MGQRFQIQIENYVVIIWIDFVIWWSLKETPVGDQWLHFVPFHIYIHSQYITNKHKK